MSRKNNFRIFDDVNEEMSYDVTFYGNGWIVYVNQFGDEVRLRPEEGILMKPTDVKDIEGKMIYEGDILKDEFDRNHKVYWKEDEGRFAFQTKGQKTEYFLIISHLKAKVIGNIYENEELC